MASLPVSAVLGIEALLLVAATAMLVLFRPAMASLAYVLAGIALPILWANFYIGDRARASRGKETAGETSIRINHWLMAAGLVVAVASAWIFATEIAK